MTDLVVWLRQQLDTDEQMAVGAGGGEWEVGPAFGARENMVRIREHGVLVDSVGSCAETWAFVGQVASIPNWRENAQHIATHDPARALRQVQAHRAILDEVARWRHTTCDDSWYSCSQATSDNGYDEYLACANDDRHGEPCDCGLEVRQRKILGPLVSIYSDRDGYRVEWATP